MSAKNDTKGQKSDMHYEGVFPATKKSGEVYYRASLTRHGKHISLGSYAVAEDAHRAYEEGLRLLSDTGRLTQR